MRPSDSRCHRTASYEVPELLSAVRYRYGDASGATGVHEES